MNCLEYALEYWELDKGYVIFYDGNHCVNLPANAQVPSFIRLELYGYKFIKATFKDVLTSEGKARLKAYFLK